MTVKFSYFFGTLKYHHFAAEMSEYVRIEDGCCLIIFLYKSSIIAINSFIR